MRFWDASAVVPLITDEVMSSDIHRRWEEDPDRIVWMFTRVEVLSALCRKLRQTGFSREDFRASKARLADYQAVWVEIMALEGIRERAMRLLEIHALRAADALQLASALVAAGPHPDQVGFVSLDQRLCEAAEKEGFILLE